MTVCAKCKKSIEVSFFKKIFQNNILCDDCKRIEEASVFVKECNVGVYDAKVNDFMAAKYMNDDDEVSLNNLQREYGLSDSDIKHRNAEIENIKRITAIKNGNLPVIRAELPLKNNSEKFHHVVSVDLVESKTRTRRVGGVPGRSIRVARGVSYRVPGVRGTSERYTVDEKTDEGKLYITNFRLIFVGSRKTMTIVNKKIIVLKHYSNAIEIKKDNQQKAIHFVYRNGTETYETQLILWQLFGHRNVVEAK